MTVWTQDAEVVTQAWKNMCILASCAEESKTPWSFTVLFALQKGSYCLCQSITEQEFNERLTVVI